MHFAFCQIPHYAKSGCVLLEFLLHYIELGWTANIREVEKMQFQTASSLYIIKLNQLLILKN
jgi:hypothetical protein